MRVRNFLAAGSVLALTACTGTSQKGLDRTQEMMTRKPQIRQEAISICIEDITLSPRSQRENMARVMRVELSRVPVTFCTRMMNAMAQGRLKQADLQSVKDGTPSANLLRIIKG